MFKFLLLYNIYNTKYYTVIILSIILLLYLVLLCQLYSRRSLRRSLNLLGLNAKFYIFLKSKNRFTAKRVLTIQYRCQIHSFILCDFEIHQFKKPKLQRNNSFSVDLIKPCYLPPTIFILRKFFLSFKSIP